MNSYHVAIIAKRADYMCTGLLLVITLGFCVIWGKESLRHTLICNSETSN